MVTDIGNYQLVGIQGEKISVMLPKHEMSKDEALVHAAWIVCLADPLGEKFEEVLQKIMST